MKAICVVGLGYIGLPTASMFASNGFQVIGVDVNPTIVDIINRGQIHIQEPGLKTVVAAAIGSGNLKASLTPSKADVFILAVPTPFTGAKKPDLSYVESATRSILPFVEKGNLVILESTSPPGTTQDVVARILMEAGFDVAGGEVHVAHCPERVLPGRILKELVGNDRIIGGITRASAEMARDLYASFVEGAIHLTDATTAEMVKLMENTFRDVNIALANELALMAEKAGISAWEVIRLANLHPRVNLHRPGPGVGGHCISVDPWFLIDSFPAIANLARQARNTNDQMPLLVAERTLGLLEGISDPRVAVLGLAYKGNVDDVRESPANEIVEVLLRRGVEVRSYDPHVREWTHDLLSLEATLGGADLVLLLTDHAEFKYLNPASLGSLLRRRVVFDTRSFLDLALWQEAGFETHLLGQGSARPQARAEKLGDLTSVS